MGVGIRARNAVVDDCSRGGAPCRDSGFRQAREPFPVQEPVLKAFAVWIHPRTARRDAELFDPALAHPCWHGRRHKLGALSLRSELWGRPALGDGASRVPNPVAVLNGALDFQRHALPADLFASWQPLEPPSILGLVGRQDQLTLALLGSRFSLHQHLGIALSKRCPRRSA